MKLFTVGPVQMLEEILEVGSDQIPYFRTEDFSNVMINIDQMLKKLLDSQNDNLIISSSGTGAMEASVVNLFTKDDKLLIVNGGSFGQRFVDICQRYSLVFQEITLDFGEKLTLNHLDKYKNQDFTGLLINHHETSSGVLYDINLVSKFCQDQGMMLVVDAISSFLSDLTTIRRLDIDMLIISSHKALALAPGLSIINVSDRAKGIISSKINNAYYFDLKKALNDFSRGQTPFTPSVSIIYQLQRRLLLLLENGGFESEFKNISKNATHFRKLIKDLPVYTPHNNFSNCLTPIMFKSEEVNAYNVFEILRQEYDIVVNPCGGDLNSRMLRIGHIGNLNCNDFELLYEALKDLERRKII